MEYEKAEPDVEEMTEIEADPGTLVETETAPVEKPPASVLETVDSLRTDDQCKSAAALLAWLGFRQLRRMAREKTNGRLCGRS